MNYDLFSKALKHFFHGDVAVVENKDNLQKSDTPLQDSTASNQANPKTKCYVCVSTGQRNIPYRIDALLSGAMDQRFVSNTIGSKKTSTFFSIHCPVFSVDKNPRELAVEVGRKVCGKNTAYVLSIGCSKEELEGYVAEGKLSEFIICAYQAEEFSAAMLGSSDKNQLSQLKSLKGKFSPSPRVSRDPSPPPQRL